MVYLEQVFKGDIDGHCLDIIKKVNDSPNFVFAIDIPSGVDGNTGSVQQIAIKADITAYLGTMKSGYFLEGGYNFVGSLYGIDFGMDTSKILPHSFLLQIDNISTYFPKKNIQAHKYEVGQVCVFAGNKEMNGAGDLACEAAYRSGCGIVKHFLFRGYSIVNCRGCKYRV